MTTVNRQTFIQVPPDVTDVIALRRLLSQMVIEIDKLAGNRGDARVVEFSDLPLVTVSTTPTRSEVQALASQVQALQSTVNDIINKLKSGNILK